jgi:alpha-tubulin suppressor-like RCC1 family protein
MKYQHIIALLSAAALAGCGASAAGFSGGSGGSSGYGGGSNEGGSDTGTFTPPPMHVTEVAVGARHSCAVLQDGSVACWGDGALGQLGDGNAGQNYHRPVAARVLGITGASAIRAGGGTTCALVSGQALCWGDGAYGQLGDGVAKDGYFQPTPVSPKGLTGVVDLSVSATSVCAAIEDGTVRCWGKNSSHMQLGFDSPDCGPYATLDGNGNTVQVTTPCETTPHVVPGAKDAVSVITGGAHACLLTHQGDARCWGADNFGQLGDGVSGPDAISPMPAGVLGLGKVVRLGLGVAHTCAASGDMLDVTCWGDNSFGQLGTGSNALPSYQTQPASVPLVHVLDLSAVENATCAVLPDQTVQCWGDAAGLLQMPGPKTGTLKPTVAVTVDGASSVRAGGGHACVRKTDATVVCWGLNDRGQVGNGTMGLGDYTLQAVSSP